MRMLSQPKLARERRRSSVTPRAAALACAVSACLACSSGHAAGAVAASICSSIDGAAARAGLPPSFLTRLIWSESSFRSDAVSPAGAEGIAQFMPGTAAERGLVNPFDPVAAIAKSAQLLADLRTQFGNLGLAAAAYNAGPARVSAWLAGRVGLPLETQAYVLKVTGRTAEAWAKPATRGGSAQTPNPPFDASTCLKVAASLRIESPSKPPPPLFEPWGAQLAAGFSRAAALRAFSRSVARYVRVIGDVRPMIIGTRLLSRGYAPFYRIRIPEPTRAAAQKQCARIIGAGGACVALRS